MIARGGVAATSAKRQTQQLSAKLPKNRRQCWCLWVANLMLPATRSVEGQGNALAAGK